MITSTPFGYMLTPRRRRPARADTALGVLAWVLLTVLAVLGHAWASGAL